mmetsp:Transcript_15421/g.31302  ORF Transcript_15421/g.31302 Transcript_15421/m.31302 type:complete len:173 (+) Transcript_15421:96-614(+)
MHRCLTRTGDGRSSLALLEPLWISVCCRKLSSSSASPSGGRFVGKRTDEDFVPPGSIDAIFSQSLPLGTPPRVKLDRLIRCLLDSGLLQSEWTFQDVVDETYGRDFSLKFAWNQGFLIPGGQQKMKPNIKNILDPKLALPPLDQYQARQLILAIKTCDLERLHKEKRVRAES